MADEAISPSRTEIVSASGLALTKEELSLRGGEADQAFSNSKMAAMASITRSAAHMESVNPPGYLKANKKHAWLMDRYHFWNGHKKPGSGVWDLGSALNIDILKTSVDPPLQGQRLKCFIQVLPEKLKNSLCSSLSRNGGDDLISKSSLSAENPGRPNDQGFSFTKTRIANTRICAGFLLTVVQGVS